MGTEPTQRQKGWADRVLSRFGAEFGLTVTIAVFALVGVRMYLISRGSLVTYRALLSYSDATTLVMSLAPYVVLVGGGLATPVVLRRIWRRSPRAAGLAWGQTVGLAAAWSVALPPFIWLALVGVCLLYWPELARQMSGRPSHESRYERLLHRFGPIAAMALMLMALYPFVSEPWLPPEVISMKDERPFTGYVLADDGDLVVLREDDREVVQLPSKGLQHELCSDSSQYRPLASYILERRGKSPRYDDCPT